MRIDDIIKKYTLAIDNNDTQLPIGTKYSIISVNDNIPPDDLVELFADPSVSITEDKIDKSILSALERLDEKEIKMFFLNLRMTSLQKYKDNLNFWRKWWNENKDEYQKWWNKK